MHLRHLRHLDLLVLSVILSTPAGPLFLSLRGTPIDDDSFVDVDSIGEGDNALLCLTNDTNCCSGTETGGAALGNWFFSSGTAVASGDFFRNRGQSVVRLNRRNSPTERGRFRCEIVNQMGTTDTIDVNICE